MSGDYLKFLKGIEKALEEGLIEESYTNGEHVYTLTEKGMELLRYFIRSDPKLFEIEFKMQIETARTIKDIIKFLVHFIYNILYDYDMEKSTEKAEKWINIIFGKSEMQ